MGKISDGLSKLEHVHGGFPEGLAMYSPAYRAGNTKIVGHAFIVKFASKADTAAPKVKGNYVSKSQSSAFSHRSSALATRELT